MEKIETELGYTIINIDKVIIVSEYDIVLHKINPKEIMNVVAQFEEILKKIENKNYQKLMFQEIEKIKNKIRTFIPHRIKRGLINGMGSAMKWLYGTLDDEDRQNIEEHFKIVDENNHNIIETVNQQIKINDKFNKNFLQMKQVIESDRKMLSEKIINYTNNRFTADNLFFETMFKLNILKEQVEHIQENIASARTSILHPSILSSSEIIEYNIDFRKLINIRLGVALYDNEKIVFAIKIPTKDIEVNRKMLIPIPNQKSQEINSQAEYFVVINNKNFEYKQDKSVQELKLSENCIYKKNCKININMNEEIEKYENMLILKNFKNGKLNSTCDERIITLNGNYLISFNNCSIKINNNQFSNKKTIYNEKFIIPTENLDVNSKIKIPFEPITLLQEENLKEIKELHFHKYANYGLSAVTIIFIIISIIIFIIYIKKNNNIKIVNKLENKSENINLEELKIKYNIK